MSDRSDKLFDRSNELFDADIRNCSFELFEAAVTYARASTYPDNCTVNQKRVIRKKAAKLRVVDGEVFMVKKGRNVSYCITDYCINLCFFFSSQLVKCVTARPDQLRIVRSCHLDPTSGHLGIKKTYNRITERFTWNAVLKDVQNMVLQLILS